MRFWSVTAYTPEAIELVDNPADKYAVASYTPGPQPNTGRLGVDLHGSAAARGRADGQLAADTAWGVQHNAPRLRSGGNCRGRHLRPARHPGTLVADTSTGAGMQHDAAPEERTCGRVPRLLGLRKRPALLNPNRVLSNAPLPPRTVQREPRGEMSTHEGLINGNPAKFYPADFCKPWCLADRESGRARAQAAPSLIVQLEAICRRLAPLGWRSMMLAVTGGDWTSLRPTSPANSPNRSRSIAVIRVLVISRSRDTGESSQAGLTKACSITRLPRQRSCRIPRDACWAAFRPSQRSTFRKLHLRRARCHAGRAACGDNGLPAAIATFALHYRNAPDWSAASMRNSASHAPE